MTKINLNAIKSHVRTQHGDMTGVIQIDGIDGILSIYQICDDYDFDISNKFIVGISLGESSILGIGKKDTVHCTILFVEESEYGNNFEEIKTKINNDQNLKLKKKSFYIKFSDLGKYIKRFDLMLTTEIISNLSQIDIEEEE